MTKPLISVLLPTHNRADTLRFALESVLKQTIREIEILVAGDGCTDTSAEVVKSYNDKRIKWFDLAKAPNFGYANRNIVLKEACGEFIAFMAHDDLWFFDHLEILSRFFKDPSIDLAYSMPLWMSPEGLLAPTPFNLYDPELFKAFVERKRNLLPAGNVLHRRSCFDRVGYWNEELKSCGDWDLWARIIQSGSSRNFVYFREPTCIHFRALWRQNPILEPGEVLASYEMRKFFPHWDQKMRIEIGKDEVEQKATWQYLNNGGQKVVDSLREYTGCFLDRRNIEMDKICESYERQQRS